MVYIDSSGSCTRKHIHSLSTLPRVDTDKTDDFFNTTDGDTYKVDEEFLVKAEEEEAGNKGV